MLYKFLPSIKITLLLLFLALIFLIIFMLNPFKKNQKYEIVENRDFYCQGMTGFTFKSPVFKGWDLNGWSWNDYPEYERCITNLVEPSKIDSKPVPSIEIKKMPIPNLVRNGIIGLPDKVDTSKWKVNKNSNNILYSVNNNILSFYTDNNLISIELMDTDGFPKDTFFKTVIESFKLTK